MKKSGKMSTVAYWLIGISLFIIISQYESVLIGFHKPVDLYAEDFKGVERFMSVDCDLDLILPSFLEETVTHKKNGSTTGVDKYDYYPVPVFVGDNVYYIGLKMENDHEKASQVRQVVKETVAFINDEAYGDSAVAFVGGVYKMKDNIYKEMKSWLKESGFVETDAEAEKYVLPYQLKPVLPNIVRTICYICFAAIVIGIILIVVDRKVVSNRRQENA